ncbi:trypsin-like serine protease [Gonapodya prolifera JEL478]|uniref:Trypsin-like serine protease n=1 Tax=Gonapodya prolifera (strain JEL478) TaxID=1344416 RepID=A0A138ZXV6_GONPJ|nr:trypsin-like serine protease [Gonapodya prolifera JEL478]|eukprot:KXS09328.1 trypsin-like serine protease [Gonapodya prolifera JEL478]
MPSLRSRSLISLLALALSGLVGLSSAIREGKVGPGDSFIVGGYTTNATAHPYVALLIQVLEDGQVTCTGSLVQVDPVPVILTAAHCGSRDDLEVAEVIGAIVGIDDLNKNCTASQQPNCRSFRVIDILQHPGYGTPDAHVDETGHDVALWVLTPIDKTRPVTNEIVPINIDPTSPAPGVNSTAVGWGITNWGGTAANKTRSATKLQAVSLLVAKPEVCEKQHDLLNSTRANIGCLLGGTHRSTCQGDSGGPHIYNGSVWGVTSFGPSTCDSGAASVVAKTSGVVDWLVEMRDYINLNSSYLKQQVRVGGSSKPTTTRGAQLASPTASVIELEAV